MAGPTVLGLSVTAPAVRPGSGCRQAFECLIDSLAIYSQIRHTIFERAACEYLSSGYLAVAAGSRAGPGARQVARGADPCLPDASEGDQPYSPPTVATRAVMDAGAATSTSRITNRSYQARAFNPTAHVAGRQPVQAHCWGAAISSFSHARRACGSRTPQEAGTPRSTDSTSTGPPPKGQPC